MLSIAEQRNAKQNQNEVSPHTCQNSYHQKDHKLQTAGKDVAKREPLYVVDRDVNWYSYCGKQ